MEKLGAPITKMATMRSTATGLIVLMQTFTHQKRKLLRLKPCSSIHPTTIAPTFPNCRHRMIIP